MRTICFVTGNPNKVREAQQVLKDVVIEPVFLDIPEIQGTAEQIITDKARKAADSLGKPCFVEDVSLNCRALGGLPGPYVKAFSSTIGTEGIWKMLQSFPDKHAEAICRIGYAVPGEEPKLFEGVVEGTIVAPRGKGWGFDAAFQPSGSTKTYGELAPEEKNRISHRGLALRAFHHWLQKEGK